MLPFLEHIPSAGMTAVRVSCWGEEGTIPKQQLRAQQRGFVLPLSVWTHKKWEKLAMVLLPS